MCKIKTTEMSELLAKLRGLDNGEKMDNTSLAEIYLRVYNTVKELEGYQAGIKGMLVERNIDPVLFPDYEQKVELSEGRSSRKYDALPILQKSIEAGKLAEVAEAINFVQERIVDNDIKKIVDTYTVMISGTPTISVRKMTKKELLG